MKPVCHYCGDLVDPCSRRGSRRVTASQLAGIPQGTAVNLHPDCWAKLQSEGGTHEAG